MEIEDGVTWIYGVDEDGISAFTDFGIGVPDRAHQDVQGRSDITQALGSVRVMRPTSDAYHQGCVVTEESENVLNQDRTFSDQDQPFTGGRAQINRRCCTRLPFS